MRLPYFNVRTKSDENANSKWSPNFKNYMPRRIWLAATNTSDIFFILMFSVWRLQNHPQNLFIVSCASLNVNPSPNLTLTLNGRPWEEISHSASVQDASPNTYTSSSSKFFLFLRFYKIIWSFPFYCRLKDRKCLLKRFHFKKFGNKGQ